MTVTGYRTAMFAFFAALTLYWGTWVASSVVAVGLMPAMLDSGVAVREMVVQRDMRIASAGIALFILLPVIRLIG